MVEIYKVIAYIPFLNQIFGNKYKNGSLKWANNNQVQKYQVVYALEFWIY